VKKTTGLYPRVHPDAAGTGVVRLTVHGVARPPRPHSPPSAWDLDLDDLPDGQSNDGTVSATSPSARWLHQPPALGLQRTLSAACQGGRSARYRQPDPDALKGIDQPLM